MHGGDSVPRILFLHWRFQYFSFLSISKTGTVQGIMGESYLYYVDWGACLTLKV